jgi:membrane glycosyltransferase
MQQFASRVYGPPLAAGMAWWTGTEGNFWGHNAILRTRAFMESAGLPELPGTPPLGGPILSHDFVEAALLRRAGWSVRIADDLPGSYESCPATLLSLSVRERRWCQGNLQHGRVLTAKGLHWISRLHLLTGILSFVSSPLWLFFLVATLALGVQSEFARPEYFPRSYTLFPIWPHLDPVRAQHLFFLTLGILLLPKALGLIWFAASAARLRGAGVLLLGSFIVEVVLSALLAPILMLIHGGFVASVLTGHDSGWQPQLRGDQSVPWTQVAFRHRWHVLVGVGLAAAAYSVSREMLAWVSPAVIGMVAAVPLSWLTGSTKVGLWAKRWGLLRTPEEAHRPEVWRTLEEVRPVYRAAIGKAPDLTTLVSDARLLRRHLAATDRPMPRAMEPILAVEATAVLKISAATTLDEAVARLTPQESSFVQADPELLMQLSRLPRNGQQGVTAAHPAEYPSHGMANAR